MVKFPLAKREPRVRFPVDASAITPASQSAVVIPYLIANSFYRHKLTKIDQIRYDDRKRNCITRLNSGVEFLVVAQNVAGSIPAVENLLLEKVEQNVASFL